MKIRKHTADLEAAFKARIKQIIDGEVATEKTNDIDNNLLAKELEALKAFLPSSIIKPHALFIYLVVNNQSRSFPNVLLLCGYA